MDRSTYTSGGDRSDTGVSVTNGSKHDYRELYSNGRRIPMSQYINGSERNGGGHDSFEQSYASVRYNEPENNRSLFLIYNIYFPPCHTLHFHYFS